MEVYHNGVRVPDEKRTLLVERFGATVEQIGMEVRSGDWLVFHAVNNRLRWNGSYYFGAAGVLGTNEFGFVSSLTSGDWSVCDDPAKVHRFIAERDYLRDNAPAAIDTPWGEGTRWMRDKAGVMWDGEPIWGRSRSTWIKYIAR